MGESNIFPGAILFAVESWVHTLTSFEILYNKHNPHNNTGKRWFNKTILIFFRRLVHSELYKMNWTKYLWKTTFPTLFVLFFGFVHLENNTFSLKSSFVSCPLFNVFHINIFFPSLPFFFVYPVILHCLLILLQLLHRSQLLLFLGLLLLLFSLYSCLCFYNLPLSVQH